MIKEGIVEVKDVGVNNQFNDHELNPGNVHGEIYTCFTMVG